VRILALAVGLLAVGVSTTTAGRSSAVVSLRIVKLKRKIATWFTGRDSWKICV
jgi:hypothetical protein